MRAVTPVLVLAAALSGAACISTPDTPAEPPVPPFPDAWNVVDLTRPLDAATPVLPHPHGFPFERLDLEGTSAGRVTGAWSATDLLGTHVETPAVFGTGDARVDRIPAGQLVLPVVVIDAPPRLVLAGGTPAPAATGVSAVYAHEARHGTVPRGSLVLLRTGAGDAAAAVTTGSEDEPPLAGWSVEAVRFLAIDRGVRALGSDGQTIDASDRLEESPAAREAARAGLVTVQGLTNLALLPRRGAVVVLGVVPVAGAPAAPARVLAFVPPASPRRDAAGAGE
jgi:kynurenine formamidase